MNSHIFAHMYVQIGPDKTVVRELKSTIAQLDVGKRKKPVRSLGVLAAAFCLLLVMTVHFLQPGRQIDGTAGGSSPAPLPESGEGVAISGWESLTPPERFNTIAWNGAEYMVSSGTVIPALVGEQLTSVTVQGIDELTGARHTAVAQLYRIEDVSPEAVVAVRYDGAGEFFGAGNYLYYPETLGQLAEDLALERYLVIENEIWDTDDYSVLFKLADTGELRRILLEFPTAKNVVRRDFETVQQYGLSTLSFGGYLDGIGIQFSFTVYDGGYIETNLLSTAKAFYIGEAQARKAREHVHANAEKENIP